MYSFRVANAAIIPALRAEKGNPGKANLEDLPLAGCSAGWRKLCNLVSIKKVNDKINRKGGVTKE